MDPMVGAQVTRERPPVAVERLGTNEPDEHGHYGYFVVRRGRPADDPVEVGDPVDVYPILEPFDRTRVETLRELEYQRAQGAPPLPLTVEQMEVVGERVASGQQPLAVSHTAYCTCDPKDPNASAVATVGITSTGLAWVVIGRERVPLAFQSEDRSGERKAYMLHPRISSHYDTMRCRHRRTWGVEMASTHLRIIKLGTPKYGSRVAP